MPFFVPAMSTIMAYLGWVYMGPHETWYFFGEGGHFTNCASVPQAHEDQLEKEREREQENEQSIQHLWMCRGISSLPVS